MYLTISYVICHCILCNTEGNREGRVEKYGPSISVTGFGSDAFVWYVVLLLIVDSISGRASSM